MTDLISKILLFGKVVILHRTVTVLQLVGTRLGGLPGVIAPRSLTLLPRALLPGKGRSKHGENGGKFEANTRQLGVR
ncbi:hypothetical protein ACROYT_G043156 [Oculina patagonica]